MNSQSHRFKMSEALLQRAERCDAWAATREDTLEQDRFVEGAYPVYASRAEGAYFWDVDGNRYVDYILGFGTVVLGHTDPRVTEAVVTDLLTGTNISPFWRPKQVELTELLTSVVPGAELVFLMKTGSDATSAALRLARLFTGRDKVIRWGYNGWHDWSCSRANGIPASVLANTLTFDFNSVASLRSAFEQHPGEVACIIMMPFEVEPPQAGFLEQVLAIAHEHGALLILDEMRSGFRMALGGAQQYFGVKADLATFSKAMANGFAISAVTGRADVMRCLGQTHMASTFYGNSAEMAAAIATVTILRDSDALDRIWKMGAALQAGLRALVTEHGAAARVTGYPPSPFLVFTQPDATERATAMRAFYTEVTRGGVLLHPNHHWFVCAALTDDDLRLTLAACRAGFVAAQRALAT